MMYLTNSFSLNMVQNFPCTINCKEITERETWEFLTTNKIVSAIGHADTARILTGIFSLEIPMNRITVNLGKDDCALVAQYSGPRLPEGSTQLPEGAKFKWLLVTLG